MSTPSATAPAATRAAVPPPYTVNGFGGDFEVIARTTGGVAISALAALDRNDIETARFIAEAANTHSQLLALLKRWRDPVVSGSVGLCADTDAALSRCSP